MLNASRPVRAGILALTCLQLGACAREPAAEPSQVEWAREALARNPGLEVLAVDPKGVFTVRMRDSGSLRTIRMDEIVAAPPPAPQRAAASEPPPAATQSAVADSGPVAPPEPAPAPAAPAQPAMAGDAGITVTRDAGRVSITGPGVSIASAAVQPSAATVAAEPGTRERAGELRSQPLICEGERLMHIDGRVIDFAGDGLIVRDGCDLYLTNSRISAGGTAVTVAGGQIHIVNSTVAGERGSIDASRGAKVYVSQASVDGMQRRFDTAQITDLGGNRYR